MKSEFWQRWGVLVTLILLFPLTILLPKFGIINPYIELVLKYIGINIILTVSLNLVNGYMGEFSVGHAGFMAVGGYAAGAIVYYGSFWLFGDASAHGATGQLLFVAALLGYAGQLGMSLPGGQLLLVDVAHPAGELLRLPLMPGPMATFGLQIPSDLSFCGFVAYRLDQRERRFPALLLLTQRFVYRQLMYGVVIRAVDSALAGLGIGWGKLERTGRVGAPALARQPQRRDKTGETGRIAV